MLLQNIMQETVKDTDMYVTANYDEYEYLRTQLIYRKEISTCADGTTLYLYEKTPNLFSALCVYYDKRRNENAYKTLSSLFDRPDAQVINCDNFDDAMRAIESLLHETSGKVNEGATSE